MFLNTHHNCNAFEAFMMWIFFNDLNGYSIAMLVFSIFLLFWFIYALVPCICPCQTLTLKPLMSI